MIIDGKIVKSNLKAIGLNTGWLQDELSRRELDGPEKVLLALLDTDGSLYIAEQPPINPVKAYFLGEGKDTNQEST